MTAPHVGIAAILSLSLIPRGQSPEQEPMVHPIDTQLYDAAGPDVRSFVREVTIEASPGQVYRAWTDGEAFCETYDPTSDELRANIDLAIGGRYEWLWDGEMGSNGCQVLSYIPDRMVSFSWNAPPSQPESRAKHTWVVVEFEPESAGTRVRLTHLGFGTAPHWDETLEYFKKAWSHVLSRFQLGLEREK